MSYDEKPEGMKDIPEVMKHDGLQMKGSSRMSKLIALAAAVESYELQKGLKTEADIEQENHEIEAQELIDQMNEDDRLTQKQVPANRAQRRAAIRRARKNK